MLWVILKTIIVYIYIYIAACQHVYDIPHIKNVTLTGEATRERESAESRRQCLPD